MEQMPRPHTKPAEPVVEKISPKIPPVQKIVAKQNDPVKTSPSVHLKQTEEARPKPNKLVQPQKRKLKISGPNSATVIQEASYRYQAPPTYPSRALDLGQQGTVTLHAEVMPNGIPRTLKIAHSSGYRLLDVAAMSAVKKWEFDPINIEGKPAITWVRVPVRFIIQ